MVYIVQQQLWLLLILKRHTVTCSIILYRIEFGYKLVYSPELQTHYVAKLKKDMCTKSFETHMTNLIQEQSLTAVTSSLTSHLSLSISPNSHACLFLSLSSSSFQTQKPCLLLSLHPHVNLKSLSAGLNSHVFTGPSPANAPAATSSLPAIPTSIPFSLSSQIHCPTSHLVVSFSCFVNNSSSKM